MCGRFICSLSSGRLTFDLAGLLDGLGQRDVRGPGSSRRPFTTQGVGSGSTPHEPDFPTVDRHDEFVGWRGGLHAPNEVLRHVSRRCGHGVVARTFEGDIVVSPLVRFEGHLLPEDLVSGPVVPHGYLHFRRLVPVVTDPEIVREIMDGLGRFDRRRGSGRRCLGSLGWFDRRRGRWCRRVGKWVQSNAT